MINELNKYPNAKLSLSEHNKIYCDDALNLMPLWPDGIFDACITDPPYNIAKKKGLAWAFSSHITMDSDWDKFAEKDYEKFITNWLFQICRLTKLNGNIFIFGSYHNIFLLGAIAQKYNLRIVNNLIWAKPNAQPNITCRMFTESTEQILWLCNNQAHKAKNWTFNYDVSKNLNDGKQMRNFWLMPTTPKHEKTYGKHPAQKPLALMERIVLTATNENDLVLDCFAGSGTTLLACKKNNRKFIGIEKSSDYCEIAKKRLASM
jgi:site-specific DNA-methyltransferase (adenine-specific)